MRRISCKRVERHAIFILSGVLSAIGALPLAFFEAIPGYDSRSHIAKTAFLMYSLSHGNYSGWSMFWYGGFQLLDTYPPLLYFLAAFLGWPWASAIVGMKIVIALSFMLSGVSIFILARDFGVSQKWSLGASLLYAFAPPHLLFLYDYGSLTYSLGFAIAPIFLLAFRKTLRNENYISALILGGSGAILLLANAPTVYVLLFPTAVYVILGTPRSKISSVLRFGLAAAFAAFSFSAFWLMPYTLYGLSTPIHLFWTPPEGRYPDFEIISLSSLLTPNFIELRAGYLGHFLLLPALASLLTLRKRDEFGLFAAALTSVLLTVGASLSDLFYKIPLILVLQFPKRFLIADVLFLSVLASIFFDRVFAKIAVLSNTRLALHRSQIKFVGLVAIGLLTLAPLVAQPSFKGTSNLWQASFDSEEKEAFEFLANQPGYFRVMVRDPYHEWFPAFTMKGSVDGWYDQATSLLYRNFTFNMYYANPTDVDRTFNGLRLLGVRYVMIYHGYGEDGPYGLQVYQSSTIAPPIFMNTRIAIFKLPESKLIYVAGSAVALEPSNPSDPESLAVLFEDLVKRPDFDPDGLVVLTAGCKYASGSIQSYEPSKPLPTRQIEYRLSNLKWAENQITFDLFVAQEAFVYISSAYFPGWRAEIDGLERTILAAPPGFMVLYIDRPGLHKVSLHYELTAEKSWAIVVSSIAWAGFIVLLLMSKKLQKPFKKFTNLPGRSR